LLKIASFPCDKMPKGNISDKKIAGKRILPDISFIGNGPEILKK